MLLEVELHPPKYDTSAPPQHSHLTSLSIFYFYSCRASPWSFSSVVSRSPAPKHLFIVEYRPWGTCRRMGEAVGSGVDSAELSWFRRSLGCTTSTNARHGWLPRVGKDLAKAVVVPWGSSWVWSNHMCSAEPDPAPRGCLMCRLYTWTVCDVLPGGFAGELGYFSHLVGPWIQSSFHSAIGSNRHQTKA
jgi:hypothetical protein